jgi:hypothetical protein
VNEGAVPTWREVTDAAAVVALVAQLILVLSGASVIQGDSPASSNSVRQLIGYVTCLGIGCISPAVTGNAIGLLAGSAANWCGDRRLPRGRWDRVDRMSSAEPISDATLRPS